MHLYPKGPLSKLSLNVTLPISRTLGPRGFQSNGELRRETPLGTSNSIFSKKGHQKISIFPISNAPMPSLNQASYHFSGSFHDSYNICSPNVHVKSEGQKNYEISTLCVIFTLAMSIANCMAFPASTTSPEPSCKTWYKDPIGTY